MTYRKQIHIYLRSLEEGCLKLKCERFYSEITSKYAFYMTVDNYQNPKVP